jgi:hypothetical protein
MLWVIFSTQLVLLLVLLLVLPKGRGTAERFRSGAGQEGLNVTMPLLYDTATGKICVGLPSAEWAKVIGAKNPNLKVLPACEDEARKGW